MTPKRGDIYRLGKDIHSVAHVNSNGIISEIDESVMHVHHYTMEEFQKKGFVFVRYMPNYGCSCEKRK